MRKAFISISTLAILVVVASPAAEAAQANDKDGFNFYKDYLRGPGRVDEIAPDEVSSGERTVYFYRTPLQLYPGLLPALEQEYKKRTGNAFKNHMLGKELLDEKESPRKRSSKAALALMLQGKHPLTTNYLDNDLEW